MREAAVLHGRKVDLLFARTRLGSRRPLPEDSQRGVWRIAESYVAASTSFFLAC